MASERDRSRSPRQSTSEEIYGLVVQREQARLAKDWSLADSIRDSLHAAGVTLFDKTNTWKAQDGRTGRIPTFTEIEAGATGEQLVYAQEQVVPVAVASSSAEMSSNEAHIRYLVQMREQARASKDFEQSDKLRDDLKALGVELFDKDKLWRAKTGESGCIIGYRGAAAATDLEINTLVIQREKARQSSDFATADKIRDELKQAGCDILDKDKIWRTSDGRTGPVPSWTQIQGGHADQAQLVMGSLEQQSLAGAVAAPMFGLPMTLGGMQQPGIYVDPAGDAALRNQIIQAALVAAQNPAAAQRTLQLLAQQVQTPVAAMPQMQVVGHLPPAAPIRSTAPEAVEAMNFITQCKAANRPVADAEIEWLVTIREKLRQNKDWTSADELRNSMRTHLGLELYEKEKRWVCTDGRQGMIPTWDRLV